MKPMISDQLTKAIHEKIITDLCIHALETRIDKNDSSQNMKLANDYKEKLKKLFLLRKQLSDYLRKEHVKIQEVVVCDDMFVEYPYYIKTAEGGIKQGTSRYWKAALKLHMKRKLEEFE
ncbi:hypothetical protein PJ311_15030 [Bacillus sp. CLL-7-23]|uniref:ArpU family transcriptional regulator n=1 Tax=Bacillus changyiensis TaxID=3004103 RepID=A0ABT4X6G7_9BACI|nr:hypothetical protein [Bacillus changyiensis]MDA7027888.1 hypothetical protein [Bacillus changyiensis]